LDADAIAGQIEAFQSAVFLQSLNNHLTVNNHHRSQDVLMPPPASSIEMLLKPLKKWKVLAQKFAIASS